LLTKNGKQKITIGRRSTEAECKSFGYEG
jgi:hypothetical protein